MAIKSSLGARAHGRWRAKIAELRMHARASDRAAIAG
jgi:hypothetical protein